MPSGTVAEYDSDRGIGVIASTDRSRVNFHCTAIADGTRMIDQGAEVRFEVVAGRGGKWEAAGVHLAGV